MINAIEVEAGTTYVKATAPQRAPRAAGTDKTFLPPGTELCEYRIEKVLGHGGFGITYLARDTHLDKPVAIKEYLPAHLAVRNNTHVSARSPNEQRAFDWGRKQFLKEAQTLARFAHPNLVPVHRYFQAHQTAYFVMSYVEGETLAARLKREPAPSEEFLRSVLLPVMDGLKVVHRAGFLHRDIKPENILLQQDGTPVLIDFGAARVNLDSVTRSTMCALTAGYAPLEQYGSAGHQGPWTDIYALGAVAYRAVTGRKPPEAVNRIHGDSLVPASQLGKGRHSVAFLGAVDWALALHPEDRPRCVLELQKALTGQVRHERNVTVPTTPAPKAPVARAAPANPKSRAEAGFSFPWATAAAPLLALGVVLALFGGLRTGSEAAPVLALPAPVLLPGTTPAGPREVSERAKVAVAAPGVEKRARAADEPVAARESVPRGLEGVAQMESLSSFQDCADCPAMTVLPKLASGKAFAIGRFEVTAAQYQQCVGAGACRKPLVAAGAGNLPVVNVSWKDAQAYSAWLSEKSGRRYRLPTESEWEYAARSGTRTDRFWGPDGKRHCQYANAADIAACRDGNVRLAAVGSFKANWFDLHDTAGNAWEWTADCWRESGAAAKACTQRAARGGSWRTPAGALRSTLRTAVAPAHRSDTLGFRVVAD